MFRSILVLLLAFVACPVQAALLNFTFSQAVAGGTVTGEIDGLNSTGTSTPTEIIITSQPSGYPNTAPINLIASGYGFLGTDNNFTVTGGAITGADVLIYKTVTGGNYQGYVFDFSSTAFGVSNENGVFLATSGLTVITSNTNTGGFAGTTYTPVPEPHETALIFLLGGLGLFGARKLHNRISLRAQAAAVTRAR